MVSIGRKISGLSTAWSQSSSHLRTKDSQLRSRSSRETFGKCNQSTRSSSNLSKRTTLGLKKRSTGHLPRPWALPQSTNPSLTSRETRPMLQTEAISQSTSLLIKVAMVAFKPVLHLWTTQCQDCQSLPRTYCTKRGFWMISPLQSWTTNHFRSLSLQSQIQLSEENITGTTCPPKGNATDMTSSSGDMITQTTLASCYKAKANGLQRMPKLLRSI